MRVTSTAASNPLPADAIVLMSFGGPEKTEDVLPFLKNVTAGRGIPDERLVEVGEHYYGFGGVSPINEQNRALRLALEAEVRERGIDLPVLWGNRNWDPYLTDLLREETGRGRRRFLAVTTSAYSSYSSCRQYREDFAASTAALAGEGLDVSIEKVRQYFDHPGFVAAQRDVVRAGVRALAEKVGPGQEARLLFVTHSIPNTMQDASAVRTAGYRAQHESLISMLSGDVAAACAEAGQAAWSSELVYCSRSGEPHVPWLEPDINDRMEELKAEGVSAVLAVPIGFVSDHMEVKYDLDTEAAETAGRLGLAYHRAATVGLHPAFVGGLVDLVEERLAQLSGRNPATPSVGGCALGPGSGACSVDCCAGRVESPASPVWDEGLSAGAGRDRPAPMR